MEKNGQKLIKSCIKLSICVYNGPVRSYPGDAILDFRIKSIAERYLDPWRVAKIRKGNIIIYELGGAKYIITYLKKPQAFL